MKFLTTAIAFLATFGAQAYDPCRTRPRQDYIQSGSVQFVNGYNFKQTCYTINIDYDIPQSGIKTAISTMSHDGFSIKNGLDYSIRARRKQNTNALSLSLLSSDRSWKKISISYLAASRQDINIGSFIADTLSLFNCQSYSTTSTVIIQQQLSNIQPNIKYNIAAYISGIRTSNPKLNAQLLQQKIDNKGLISMKLNTNTNNIQNIYINYIIWKQNNFQFRIFRPTDSNINNIQSDYKFIGIHSFNNSKQLAQGLALISDRMTCNGLGCINTCCNRSECLNRGGQLYNNICIICHKNQKYTQGKCIPNCGIRYIFDKDKGGCVCDKGLVQWNKQCVQQCGYNQQRNSSNGQCQCKYGYVKLGGGVCRQCPQNSKYSNGICICNNDCKWDQNKYICVKIPPPIVVPPVLPPVPQCPAKSIWNQSRLQCECTVSNQYMINNRCQKCVQNQGWNGRQCVCKSGLYRVGGVCRPCDINSTYDARAGQCICNWGFYQNSSNGICQKCHITCGRCKGPGANQCQTCSDISLQYKNGYCSKNTCPPGFYVNSISGQCQLCSSYCNQCVSQTVCQSCVTGFKLQQTYLDRQKISACTQICGDGRRFQDQCDDGNTADGDGCSSMCKVQKYYTCQGATTNKKSTCVKFIPNQCIINPTKSVQLVGKVVQGIRLTYIPKQLTQNQCMNCYKILQIKVLSSAVVPGLRLTYIPKSQYQFMCQFDFNGLWAIPVFTISIQINPQFNSYFSKQDMAQLHVKTIDPALLIRHNQDQQLIINQQELVFEDDN